MTDERTKADISTLEKTGHLYFGPTHRGRGDRARRRAPLPGGPQRPWWSRGRALRSAVLGVLLAGATIAVYWPVGGHGFVSYDDNQYVSDNPSVQAGLTWDSVRWAFTATHASNWHPVTWLSHMLDCQLFGLDAGWHHRTSVLWHVLNALLLLAVLGGLTGRVWASAFVAAVFALHPLHVDSVAWIAERKDVLSGCFFLLTLGAYGAYARRRSLGAYALALAAFALGLMSKPMVVTVPFVLLLLDFWPLRRVGGLGPAADPEHGAPPASQSPGRLLAEKLPFFALSVGASLVTLAAQAPSIDTRLPWWLRIGNALLAYARYLGKTLWPRDLAVFYPLAPEAITPVRVAAALALLLGVSALALWSRRRAGWALTGWLCYLGRLVPVIGLVPVGQQSAADRYMYLPMIGLLIPIAWGAGALRRVWPALRLPLWGGALALLLALSVVCRQQVGVWRSGETLWRHALAVTGDHPTTRQGLGEAMFLKGDFESALRHYQRALEMAPDQTGLPGDIAMTLLNLKRYPQAERWFRRALPFPADRESRWKAGLGVALSVQGRSVEATPYLEQALALDPNQATAHEALAILRARAGRDAEAEHHFRAAVRLEPDHEPYRENLEKFLKHRASPR